MSTTFFVSHILRQPPDLFLTFAILFLFVFYSSLTMLSDLSAT